MKRKTFLKSLLAIPALPSVAGKIEVNKPIADEKYIVPASVKKKGLVWDASIKHRPGEIVVFDGKAYAYTGTKWILITKANGTNI